MKNRDANDEDFGGTKVRSKQRPAIKVHTRSASRGQFKWRVGQAPRYGHSKLRTADNEKASTSSSLDENHNIVPSPVTLLNKGNSDAFRITVVAVGPQVNELLTFFLRYFEPFIASMEKGPEKITSYLNKMYQTPYTALYDRRIAHATLAQLALLRCAVVDDPSTRMFASELITEAYAQARREVARSGNGENVMVSVLALLSFEAHTGNYKAASVHAKILHRLLIDEKLANRSVGQRMIKSAFFADWNRSLMSWTAPIILMEEVVPHDTLSLIPVLISNFERAGTSYNRPDSQFHGKGIPNGDLRGEFDSTLLLFRLGMVLNDMDPKLRSRVWGESTAGLWAIKWGINLQRLFQIHLAAKAAASRAASDTGVQRRSAAISLAMLYWNHCAGKFDFIDSERAQWKEMAMLWSPTVHMLAELEECVHAIDWQSDDDAPPELKLWLLYICTLAEQTIMHIKQSSRGWMGRHNQAFIVQAKIMGLLHWKDVTKVLRGYAWLHQISRVDEAWFNACLAQS